MAEFPDRTDVYAAARAWRDACLRADRAVLTGDPLWSGANAAELVRRFVDHPDVGPRSFEEKLEDQLRGAPPAAIQLCAEMLWLMMLFPSNYLPDTKRDLVARVWAWSGTSVDSAHCAFAPFQHGIGSGGPGYNNFRPMELELLILFVQAWKALPEAEQTRLLGDGWEFANWFDDLPDAQNRQFRHMLLHLLFPDDFERCSSAGDKRKVEKAFLAKISDGQQLAKSTTPLERDRRIQAIRRKLEQEMPGVVVDFYTTPAVRAVWNPMAAATPVAVSEGPSDAAPPFPRAKRVWLIAAGVGGSLVDRFRDDSEIAIGWDELGDLSQYKSYDMVKEAIQRVYETDKNPVNNALACDQFAHAMQIGDEVYVKQGWFHVLAHGVITGEYEYDPSRIEYCNTRAVEWKKQHDWRLPEEHRLPMKTLTEITAYSALLSLLREQTQPGTPTTAAPKSYSADDIMKDAFLSRQAVDSIVGSLGRRKNIILQGPPGVGKSFLARKIAYALIGRELRGNVEGVQFHQSYSYDDFMQGYRPASGAFELKDGVFHRFCRNAQDTPSEKFVFIIDEINRGNLSKIFGELMYLIEADKRGPDHALSLTYGESAKDRFFVPENVYVIGLMNTADRSLAMVDYALRRRFAFHNLEPALSSVAFATHLESRGVQRATIARIRANVAKVNEVISADHQNLGAGFAIGHSYFCPVAPVADSDAWYESIVHQELLPLLTEYWFDNPKKVKECETTLLAKTNG